MQTKGIGRPSEIAEVPVDLAEVKRDKGVKCRVAAGCCQVTCALAGSQSLVVPAERSEVFNHGGADTGQPLLIPEGAGSDLGLAQVLQHPSVHR